MNTRLRFRRVPLTASIAALATFASVLLPVATWADNEIGYIEKFALAPDREKVLGELVPGSEEYYFFHALHYQNTRQAAKLTDILAQWTKRFPGESSTRRVILNREALLSYDATPQETLKYLRDRLGLQFNHQQEARDKKPNLPTVLDPARIARAIYEREALAYDGGLQTLSVETIESLIRNKTPLSPQQQRAALTKLTRPDVPNLVEFIASELKMKDSGGFGQFAIHRALLPDQLDALAKLIPTLTTNDAFVFTKIRKLAPNADVEIEYDAAEREAWLDRVWAYVSTLPTSFNTVKAHVLYLRLDHDRKRGVYNNALFTEYLKLPRGANWVNPKWLEGMREKQAFADVNADLSEALVIRRPIGNDEPLVREYFLELFQRAAAANLGDVGEGMMDPYTAVVRESWLKPILAEALIVGGHGRPEQWASLLTPQAFQKLKDRVDIEFPRTNAQFFAPGSEVQFDVTLKNTPKVIVKIYELNTLNFFLTQGRQLNTDVSLDGLVANSERVETSDAGPFKRNKSTFKFPELKGRRGAWIVEFIGGGRSSRALVRVGQWQTVQVTSPAGDMLTVLDEQGEPAKEAVAWLDGRKYTPDEKTGRITVPFTAQPGMASVVLADAAGTFATLTQIERHGEAYALDAQFNIEREQLLARRQATLAIRPALMLGESHLDPGMLSEPRLVITSQTHDGISTTREVKDLKLNAGGVLTYDLAVPERLANLTVAFYAKVEVASAGGEKRDVSASHSWSLNGIDKTAATNDGHLSKFEGNYVYELLGKNGEPIADQQVVFTFRRDGFDRTLTSALKTDEKGRVALGTLDGIKSFHAKSPNGRDAKWELDSFERTWSSTIHTAAGQPVRVPLPPMYGEKLKLDGELRKDWLQSSISLLEISAGTFTANLGSKMTVEDGFLVIPGLTPGDYSLRLRGEQRDITIKVSGGKLSQGWYLGAARNLEAKAERPLQINDVATDKDFITIKLANVNPFTRVHIAASRFEPGRGIFAGLGGFTRFGASEGAPARLPNLYSAGREIGDEYRYILDRRYAKAYPGNMLTRPGLLLNPWAVRDTSVEQLAQQAGEQAGGTMGGRGGALRHAAAEAKPGASASGPSGAAADTNLDFLAESAPAIYNLIPEKDGTVKIDRKMLGDRQHVQIYAEDLTNAAWRSFALPEAGTKFADLRLAHALDPAKPFTQKKETTVLAAGKALTLEDILTSELETYDTLSGVHSLLTTLHGDAKFAEFAWILQWPKMKDDEKRAKYSEYACHELNFFLARKDPEFFDKVIKPNLANKKDKTFLDDFLLGADLAKYLQPTAYAQLNVVECALLAQRVPAGSANIARSLREQWELVPPNPERADQLFETALRGRELEAGQDGEGGGGGLRGNLERQKEKAESAAPRDGRMDAAKPMAMPPPAPAAPASAAMPTPDGASSLAVAGKAQLQDLNGRRKLGLAKDAKSMDRLEKGLESLSEDEARKMPEAANAYREFKKRDESLKRLTATGGVVLGTDKDDSIAASDFAYFGRVAAQDVKLKYRALYRQIGATKEWAENNYYHLRITEQKASLVGINAFWRDYAAHVAGGNQGAFVSGHIVEASSNFTEMMLALAVTDLPFDAPKHASKADGNHFTLTAGGPVIVYHKEIKPAAPAAAAPQGQLLVSQSFFREGDRYRQEGNERFEKYVTEEFLTGTVYGANVVVTNPTSSPAKAEVLLQIPQGAVPVVGSKATQSRYVRLEPYTTKTFEYYFYFPSIPGVAGAKFSHFPVNVAIANTAAAAAKPFEFNVVGKLSQVDKASWDYVSQYGTDAEVFTFLEQNNLAALPLPRVAWRCHDAAFFKKLTAFLHSHHIWDDTIYSYAVVHNDAAALREWLKHHDEFINQCGPYLSTKLILVDPIERRAYEHLEYSPLVNQRAHKLGAELRIANPAVLGQYQSLLNVLAYKPQLDAMDSMSVTYYEFLQDRVDEALTRFHSIDAKLLPTTLQHDYFRCYADFYESNLPEARGIAAKYADYPIARWRNLFGEVSSQLDEIEGKAAAKKGDDKPDREKDQAGLASTEPTLDFKVENKNIALTWKNLGDVTINYYLMDPEFSFSSNPFVSEDASRFSIIKPSKSAKQELPKGKDTLDIPLPGEFAKANVLVEVVGAGQRKAQPYHANTLKLTVTENYGLLETRDSASDKPVAKAYVKVYARLSNGTVRFFKDGYTDLRGRFDYASLNSSGAEVALPAAGADAAPANGLDYQMLKPAELNQVDKLAILILSDTNGALTREVNPPKQ